MLPSSIRGAMLAGLLILAVSYVRAEEEEDAAAELGAPEGVNCGDGLLIPIWRPYENLSGGDRFGRGVLYVLLMVWLFIGVAIVSDRFMESIEMITAQEKEVTVKDPKTGKNQIVIVKVWNETVANLTLMALGSSAPEIMLSVIEIWAKGFKSGDLGPGTIVGSAAFNLLCISAVCVAGLPRGETRRIDMIVVFGITASFSIFAYVWLLVILKWSSPDIVEMWEAILTFLFFPILVVIAYLADKGYLSFLQCKKSAGPDVTDKQRQIEMGSFQPGESTYRTNFMHKKCV